MPFATAPPVRPVPDSHGSSPAGPRRRSARSPRPTGVGVPSGAHGAVSQLFQSGALYPLLTGSLVTPHRPTRDSSVTALARLTPSPPWSGLIRRQIHLKFPPATGRLGARAVS